MRIYVGITDRSWFDLLAAEPYLEEVNFWQPGGTRRFQALQPGELFLFKLHSPDDFVVGGGVFGYSTLVPASLAWESFGRANGASTFPEMRARIERYRRAPPSRDDYQIGCILLEQPFFLPREAWFRVPSGWAPNIVSGKTFDGAESEGAALLAALEGAMALSRASPIAAEPAGARYGAPQLVAPRLGQGTFRILVTDAYERRCAITGERTLPVLQAAHIRPYALGGDHRVQNGLLLRSDLHTLFDRGYVTVTKDAHVEVSRRLREDFENGRDYYALHGRPLRAPLKADHSPAGELLDWHNREVFLA